MPCVSVCWLVLISLGVLAPHESDGHVHVINREPPFVPLFLFRMPETCIVLPFTGYGSACVSLTPVSLTPVAAAASTYLMHVLSPGSGLGNGTELARAHMQHDRGINRQIQVAVLCVGALRGFELQRAERMVNHLLSLASTDLFLCNEPGDVLDDSAKQVLESGADAVFVEEQWSYEHIRKQLAMRRNASSFAKTGPGVSYVHNWALRATRCYEASISRNESKSYDFFVRTRPDLVFDAPVPSPTSWSTSAVSSRARAFAGPSEALTAASFSWQPTTCGGAHTCTAAEGCEIMDDMFYIASGSLAPVVFSYGATETVTYDDDQWCNAAPIRKCRQGDRGCPFTPSPSTSPADTFSEMHLTHFLAVRHALPLDVISLSAFVSRDGITPREGESGETPADWNEPRSCDVDAASAEEEVDEPQQQPQQPQQPQPPQPPQPWPLRF